MEDNKILDHNDEISNISVKKETLEIENRELDQVSESISNVNDKINPTKNVIDKGINKIVEDKKLEENKKVISTIESKSNGDKSNNDILKKNAEIDNEKTLKDNKLAFEEPKSIAANKETESVDNANKEITKEKILEENKRNISTIKTNAGEDKSNNDILKKNAEIDNEKTLKDNKLAFEEPKSIAANKETESVDNANKEITKEKILEENKRNISTIKTNGNEDKNNPKEILKTIPTKATKKPVKEPPIEKKPFLEFINDYLIPEIKNEFKLKGKEVNKINLQKTHRPIAEDLCWVIYCEINDTCNFWLSFEKDDITSLKSFSLCKNYEKPSIIESFLIDEKKITLKLIISRILQRLNGQKLIGAN